MKNLFLKAFLLIFIVIVNSCSKSSQTTPPVYPVAATVNGTAWHATSNAGRLFLDTVYNYRVVDITVSGFGKTITIEFMDNGSGTGIVGTTHNFPGDARFYYSDASGSYGANNGWIQVTANDPAAQTFSANFAFTAQQNNAATTASVQQGAVNNVHYSIVYGS